MFPIQPSDPSRSRLRLQNRTPLVTALISAMLFALAFSAPALAQQEPTARPSAEERRQKMEERRRQRAEAAAEMRARRNDPEFLKQKAWWNDEANVTKFGLKEAQRKTADQALAKFVGMREEANSNAKEAQEAFFEALASGAADIQAKKDRMISTRMTLTEANADLRITVMGALTADQRAKLQEENPRLLRSNWIDPRGADASNRRLQRSRDNGSNR